MGSGLEGPARRVVDAFVGRFGQEPPFLVRAPGRVNLIGEHTDYNDGFVLPMAIERAVWIALRPRADGTVRVHSTEYDQEAVFELDPLRKAGARVDRGPREVGGAGDVGPAAAGGGVPGWAEYLRGTAWSLLGAGHRLVGWEGALGSDVPIGAGLSSSAALELATARAFAAVSGLAWDPRAMARRAQRAENQWVGVSCGIMDQTISAVGREGHAVLIDCRSLETTPVPLPVDTAVVILDTGTRRGLVDSAYNERRRRCEAAAAALGVPALRDVTPELLAARSAELDPVTARRARHVVTENARTVAAADAMREGDAAELGVLMDASHGSLRDDFEVSSEALDIMVDVARARPGCLGARMTGAGFGGCAVALVEAGATAEFAEAVAAGYRDRTGEEPRVYVTGAAAGASVASLQ